MEWLTRITEYVLHMGWKVTFVIVAVLLGRWLLRGAPAKWSYALWIAVAVRLLCPWDIPMVGATLSLSEWGEQRIVGDSAEMKPDGSLSNKQAVEDAFSPLPSQSVVTRTGKEAEVPGKVPEWIGILWLSGTVVMLGYGVVSYWHLGRRLACATRVEKGVYECDNFSTPFVYGIFHPAIYIPYRLSDSQKECILRHERVHLERKDYLLKVMAALFLALYWFQPFMWLAFYYMSEDMEMSCDARVLRGRTEKEKEDYSTILLGFATNSRRGLAGVVTFGENFTKTRIQRILKQKKAGIVGIFAGVLVTGLLLIVSMSGNNQPESGKRQNGKDEEQQVSLENNAGDLFTAKDSFVGSAPANEKLLREIQMTVKPAEITENTGIGADGPVIDYEDGKTLVFHDYFGLFVYDVEQESMRGTLDLQYIGCNFTQGDEYCEVRVTEKGDEIYLHNIAKDRQYCYNIKENTLVQSYIHEGVQYETGGEKSMVEGEIIWGETGMVQNWQYKIKTEDMVHPLFTK